MHKRLNTAGILTLMEESWLGYSASMATAICLTVVLGRLAEVKVNINYGLSGYIAWIFATRFPFLAYTTRLQWINRLWIAV